MSPQQELAFLAMRKRELLARSAVHRLDLTAQCEALRRPVSWVEAGIDFVQMARPVLALAAPLLGFFFGRRWRRRGTRRVFQLSSVVRLVFEGIRIWRSFRSRAGTAN